MQILNAAQWIDQVKILIQQGNIGAAKKVLSKGLTQYPNNIGLLYEMAGILFSEGSNNEAVHYLEKIIEKNSKNVVALMALGAVLSMSNEHQKAHAIFLKVLKIEPNNYECIYNLARLKELEKKYEDAIGLYKNCLTFNAGFKDALLGIAICFERLNLYDEALSYYEKILQNDPFNYEIWLNQGEAQRQSNKLLPALESFQHALKIKYNMPEAWSNQGITLHELGRYEEALESYKKAIQYRPDYPEAWSNQGITLHELGRYEEALESYKKAIQYRPDYPEAWWNKSMINLTVGNFSDGWKEYEWRLKVKALSGSNGYKISHLDFDKLDDIKDQSILLYSEQGYGDTIQFSRYAKKLAEFNKQITIAVQKPLIELMKNIDGIAKVIDVQEKYKKNYDLQYPLPSLPNIFKNEYDVIPYPSKFLISDEAKVHAWEKRLRPKQKKRVGIAWSSFSSFKMDKKRSLSLVKFLEALPVGEYEYICLQKEIKKEDERVLKAHSEIKFYGDHLHDFSDTAALIDCCDLVISTCTSIPHLSGALGKETWLMLSFVPDWRWGRDIKTSPWCCHQANNAALPDNSERHEPLQF